MDDLTRDPRVTKMLASPAGRVGFAAVFGLLFLESVTLLRGAMQMAAAWQEHTSGGDVLRLRGHVAAVQLDEHQEVSTDGATQTVVP